MCTVCTIFSNACCIFRKSRSILWPWVGRFRPTRRRGSQYESYSTWRKVLICDVNPRFFRLSSKTARRSRNDRTIHSGTTRRCSHTTHITHDTDITDTTRATQLNSTHLSHLSTLIMPNVSIPTGQDWDAVNAGKSHAGRVKKPQTARELDAAKAKGLVATEKRYVVLDRKRSDRTHSIPQ
jgi:hypothetical protein